MSFTWFESDLNRQRESINSHGFLKEGGIRKKTLSCSKNKKIQRFIGYCLFLIDLVTPSHCR
jgi:hypothetical protein